MANIVVSAIATFNGKGLTKGQKQIKSFEKSVKSLGRTFGLAFTAAGIVNFSKKAVNAFIADEAAAKSLETQLKNMGYAFSAPDVEYFIANMQKLYGVLDDQLRPAFQTLLTASGSIVKSQKALNTVLNVSAATGKTVEEVSAAIAKGFSGQTTALTRLGAGLSKTTLASGDMVAILDELDAKFAGQATARLGTYAGKMDQLKVAAANASEIIGKDLLDSLSRLSNDNSLSGFTGLIEGLALKLASIDKAVFNFVGNMLGIKQKNNNSSFNRGERDSILTTRTNKARKDEYAIITASNKARTDIDKLKDKFDVERIGLTAALNAATDEETKLRIKSQLAILDNNEALAKKYLAELNAVSAVSRLTDELNNTADALAKLRLVTQADYTKQMYAGSSIYYNTYNTASVPMGSAGGGTTIINNTPTVTVEGSVISQDAVLSTVQEALQRLQKQGSPIGVSGGL
jgi:hypothetical protein